MTTTDTPATLAQKIAAAMADAGEVTKSSTNTDQNYKFASAEAILKAVRVPLLSRGVVLLASVDGLDEREITARSGSKGTRVIVSVTFTFTDGADRLELAWRGEGQDYGDKAYGKAYTNAVKTFIRTTWLLPTEHDDPESSSSGERVSSTALPAWASPLGDTDDAKAMKVAALDVLEPLIGDRATAREYLAALANAAGGIPVAVAGWLSQLPQWQEAAKGAGEDPPPTDPAPEQPTLDVAA